MNGRIFGFQRLVWWPKWTPASRSERRGRGNSPWTWTAAAMGAAWGLISVVMARSFSVVPPLPRGRQPPPRCASAEGAGSVAEGHRAARCAWGACGLGVSWTPPSAEKPDEGAAYLLPGGATVKRGP